MERDEITDGLGAFEAGMSADAVAATEAGNRRARKAATRLFKAARELSADLTVKEQAIVVFNCMATLAAFAIALVTEGLSPSPSAGKGHVRAAALRNVKRLSRTYAAEVRKLLPPKGSGEERSADEEEDQEEG